MAKKQYNVITRTYDAQPRSQRLRRNSASSSGSTVNVTMEGGGSDIGDGHTHTNKTLLDALVTDLQNYLYLRMKKDEADDSTLEKIKAGFADEASYSARADVATDSDQWDGRQFADYLDQAVRKTDTVDFLKVIAKGFQTPNFIPGIETGCGAGIDADGNGEMTSLILRSFLKVPQLIYNEVEVTGGELWNTPGATIASVAPDPDSTTAYTLTLDIEDGDVIKLDIDDICKGRYNKNGGYATSYFRVVAVDQAAKTIRVVLGADSEVPGGKNTPPNAFMNIARYGNFTNVERQSSQYFSSGEQRIALLAGVDDYIISPNHYKVIIGNVPESLIPRDLPIEGKASIYLDNVLARNFFQVDANNEIVKIIRDRGLWSLETAQADRYLNNKQYQDEVYHRSCKWRCLKEGTNGEPRYDSTDWLLVAGDTTLKLDIESTEGSIFLYGHLETTLKATVNRGVEDITNEILPNDWRWTRKTGNLEADTIWNTNHAHCTSEITLTNEDLSCVASGRFVCEAFVRDGSGGESLHEEVAF